MNSQEPLLDLDTFEERFIDANRGKPLFLIRYQNIQGMEMEQFLTYLRNEVHSILNLTDVEFCFHMLDADTLLMGISPYSSWRGRDFPNIDSAVGRFHDECANNRVCLFDFGVARTQCNYISDSEEILQELLQASEKNLKDNLTRWSWTYFNRANTYIAGAANEAMIQPTISYDPHRRTFTVKGGEVFVGGGVYQNYRDLIQDIPSDQDLNRIELLILEKLIVACENAPGLLKFNISPQSLIDTFSQPEKVQRLQKLWDTMGLHSKNIRFELVEKPYEEHRFSLKDVCEEFWKCGVSFAADDFGVKSQSHQVVLELGIMIKEFKLDPISFRFKANEDQIKFLDNLAFIDYCKRLADNREAMITAEAVEDFDTLQFLMEHQIYQYQSNIFCGKMPIDQYKAEFSSMSELPESVVKEIVDERGSEMWNDHSSNIFELARNRGQMPRN
ncbi:MAG TPA: diguanylate phosphodiesterase [Leptospiraceae bacterium]|nr:diguanylate phosphodiesterase [Spirochaetaceae bacterium]HBS04228.1 diguanylate phosphodiesterase [Leptospiraceae bacterium]|tara:strand:+ start:20638 stop:21972 length:1335 start_codon:yes stop_codon:yes gene_type:complete